MYHCKPNMVITGFSACRKQATIKIHVVMQSYRNGDKHTLVIYIKDLSCSYPKVMPMSVVELCYTVMLKSIMY